MKLSRNLYSLTRPLDTQSVFSEHPSILVQLRKDESYLSIQGPFVEPGHR